MSGLSIYEYPRRFIQDAWNSLTAENVDTFTDVVSKHAHGVLTKTLKVSRGAMGYATDMDRVRETGLRVLQSKSFVENIGEVTHRAYISMDTGHDSDGWNTNVHIVHGRFNDPDYNAKRPDGSFDTVTELKFILWGVNLPATKKSLSHAYGIKLDQWLLENSGFIIAHLGASNIGGYDYLPGMSTVSGIDPRLY